TLLGRHARIRASMASQRGPCDPTGTMPSGEAVRLTLSPQATPIRRCPKSNPRTMPGERGSGAPGSAAARLGAARSGIAADRTDARQLDAQQAPCRMPTRLERQIEDDPGINGS